MTKEELKRYIDEVDDIHFLTIIKGFVMGMLAQKKNEQEREKQITDEAKKIAENIKTSKTDTNVLEMANRMTDDIKWLIVQLIKEKDMKYQDEYREFIETTTLEELFIKFSVLANDSMTLILEVFGMLLTIEQSVDKEH